MKKGIHNNIDSSFALRHSKGRNLNWQAEKQALIEFLTHNTATASMAEEETGIKQKNITRHKRELEKAGLLRVLFIAPCKITKFKAGYLTCNPLLMKGGNSER